VERTACEHDRRVVVCRLTERGRREVSALKATKQARWESALSDVPVDDLRAAAQVLERVGEMFDEASSLCYIRSVDRG
jgi:DNA-binding MarR family transcriptional regulator